MYPLPLKQAPKMGKIDVSFLILSGSGTIVDMDKEGRWFLRDRLRNEMNPSIAQPTTRRGVTHVETRGLHELKGWSWKCRETKTGELKRPTEGPPSTQVSMQVRNYTARGESHLQGSWVTIPASSSGKSASPTGQSELLVDRALS